MLKTFLKQPLVHFLLLGGLLFFVYGWLNDSGTTGQSNRIVIDQDRLLEFLQFRNGAFNREAAQQYLLALDDTAYQRLLGDLIREEVLYREALKAGMDSNDYVIKRRLVQKMEYLARGFGVDEESLSDAELQAYLEAHLDRYRRLPRITFTHVFLSADRSDTEQRAADLLEQLNTEQVSSTEGLAYGDRFLYHSNYADRDLNYIASQFGPGFVDALAALQADPDHWQGPIASEYGLHLVMIASKQAGGVPDLTEVRDLVLRDAMQDKLQEQTDAAISNLVDSYQVVDKTERGSANQQGSAGD